MIKSLDKFLQEIDEGDWAVISSATDYPENWVIPDHSHEKHQLLYATEGVMVVHSAHNQWTVPPNRGFWMPCGHVHSLRCVGALKMRSVFVRPDSFPNLPTETKAVSISPLLSELIKASVSLKPPYAEDSRDARIMHLILDELALLPALPLSLPQPADLRIQQICLAWQEDPGDASTVADWSERLALDPENHPAPVPQGHRHDLRPMAPAGAAAAGTGAYRGGAEDYRRGPGAGLRKPQRIYQHVQETVWQDPESFFPLTSAQ